MNVELRQIVSKHGYALVAQYQPELETVEAVSLLGSVLTLEGFSAVQELRPHAKSSAPPNTYSGSFGTGEFPMHTDLAHWAVPLQSAIKKESRVVVHRLFHAPDLAKPHKHHKRCTYTHPQPSQIIRTQGRYVVSRSTQCIFQQQHKTPRPYSKKNLILQSHAPSQGGVGKKFLFL